MKSVKTPLILAVLAMFLASLAVAPVNIQAAVAQNEGPGKITAEKLIDIAEKAINRTKAIFAAAASANITIPEAANNSLTLAEDLLAQSESSLALGDVQAAVEKAIESMKSIREALRLLVLPEEEGEEAQEAAKAVGLSNAINRTRRFIERLEDMADTVTEKLSDLTEQGLNVTNAEQRLTMAMEQLEEARNHLAQAEQLLSQGNFTAAAKEHGMAQSTAAKALQDIRQAAKPEKNERVREFVEKFDKRLSRFEERLDKLLDKIPPQALERIRDNIEEAKVRLNATREDVRRGNFENAIDKLEDTLERLERAAERLEEQRPVISERLEKVIQALQANLERFENRIQAAEREGKAAEKIAEVKEKLEELKEKLEEIKQDVRDGKVEDAAEKINELQEKLDELAAKLESNSGRGGERGRNG